MSFSLERARATIKKITPDKKADGDGAKALVAALRVEVKTSADVLAEFHPQLRAAATTRRERSRIGIPRTTIRAIASSNVTCR